MNVAIYIENGEFLSAKAIGASGTFVGEMIFNTSMSGYQEILSDPSYAGQFIVFTMPEIGIVGCNKNDMESTKMHAQGMFASKINTFSSNYRSEQNLQEFLQEQNKIGIYNVDTRKLVKILRKNGSLNAIVSTEIYNKDELKHILDKSKKISELNLVDIVSTKNEYTHENCIFSLEKHIYPKLNNAQKCVAVIDYGVKKNILNEFASVGIKTKIFPHNVDANTLIELFKVGEINGVFLSNGPGDPKSLTNEIEQIKHLIKAKIPMFGICLGHQLLSNAFGYETYKLKFGQHGANHPVQNLHTGAVEITSQNHNYNVPENIAEVANITHRNLFDNTIEGVSYKNMPIFSVQHHPESSSGPHESQYLFKQFLETL